MSISPRQDDYTPSDAVLAEYLDRIDRSEILDQERFIREHPEAADELRQFFDDLDVVFQETSAKGSTKWLRGNDRLHDRRQRPDGALALRLVVL